MHTLILMSVSVFSEPPTVCIQREVISVNYYSFVLLLFMSLPSLEKYFQENPVIVSSGTQDTTVIVVSDSKSRYLQRQVQNTVPEWNIIWESQPG